MYTGCIELLTAVPAAWLSYTVRICNCSIIGPQLSEFPLSEPSVIRTLFRILLSQKTIWSV